MNRRVAKKLKRIAISKATEPALLRGNPASYPKGSWPAIYKALKKAYLAGDKDVVKEVRYEGAGGDQPNEEVGSDQPNKGAGK